LRGLPVYLQPSLNIFSILGILVLFAVVKRTPFFRSTTQISSAQAACRVTRPSFEANSDRLETDLMTTVAFVAGMIP
jgi:HAE1 family hydrophobic/amphiphilic exporter-1